MTDVPFNTLANFVKSPSKPNVLWVYGPGDSGKTTLINRLSEITQEKYSYISARNDLTELTMQLPKLVVIVDVDDCNVADVRVLTTSNPLTKFIIETQFMPPTGLVCQMLPMTKIYK